LDLLKPKTIAEKLIFTVDKLNERVTRHVTLDNLKTDVAFCLDKESYADTKFY